MAITYDAGTNKITVTGYTEVTPCNFTDMYNADKADTLSLHARTGITGTDGAVVAVDRAERPADYVVLGGGSDDLYITIANWVGTTATIRITGTDRDGVAQTEDIVVTANGNYSTTKWFKTITHTQVTVFTGTSFDYELIQGQWGVVWKQGDYQFTIESSLYFGDGTIATWFADENKEITFLGYSMRLYDNAHFRLGKVEDATEKTTSNGCSLIVDRNSSYLFRNYNSNGEIEFYSCYLYHPIAYWRATIFFLCKQVKMWNSIAVSFSQGTDYCKSATSLDFYNVHFQHFKASGLRRSTNVTVENLWITDMPDTWGTAIRADSSMTVKNPIIRNCTWHFMIGGNIILNLINPDVDEDWKFWTSYPSLCKGYIQYEFDLKVIDKDEVTINGAAVKIWDKGDNLVVDDTTDANGELLDGSDSYVLNWGYFSKDYGVGNPYMQTPHKIRISKAGYQTYEKKFTCDEKIDWRIRLKHSNVCVDQEVMSS